ncbi:hypothetical protein [Kitasatospora sp. NPDC059571]|uniref:hypothetical protein n=1 Tax=Kitasatospora sp. NPDC059571 TaxID=3346871 RepID=UPI0036A3FE21
MSKNRSRRIDRDTAELLLGGGPVGSEAGPATLTGHAALAGLLAAAAAPAEDGELPGEREAVAAFREARRNPALHTGRATMADHARRRAFTVKALVAAFAVTAIGSVAVAAGTGNLPRALGGGGTAERTPPAATGTPDASAAHGGSTASGRPSGSGTDHTDAGGHPSAPAGSGTASPGTGAAAVPELSRLCTTYLDRLAAGGKRHELLADVRLAPLVAAAGGAGKVDQYCAALAAPSPSATHGPGKPEPTPTPTRGGDRTKTPLPSVTEGLGKDGAVSR